MPHEQLEHWIDLSMAMYPVYIADGTMLKEMSRGDMSVIYLKNGVIQWKRSLGSIDADMFSNPAEKANILTRLDPRGHVVFMWLSMSLVGLLLVLWVMSQSRTLFLLRRKLRKKRNS